MLLKIREYLLEIIPKVSQLSLRPFEAILTIPTDVLAKKTEFLDRFSKLLNQTTTFPGAKKTFHSKIPVDTTRILSFWQLGRESFARNPKKILFNFRNHKYDYFFSQKKYTSPENSSGQVESYFWQTIQNFRRKVR